MIEGASIAMVSTPTQLQDLCKRIAGSARVGLDTEFHNERSYAARLMVVQLAFEDGSAIVDPLAIDDLRPLAEALAGTQVAGHALTSDLKIFSDRFAIVPEDVFDCQVAASFLGYGMSISLADLVRDICNVRLKKSHTVSDWSTRPFSPGQIEYLIDDVVHLLEMQDVLSRRLREKGRYEWAMDESRLLGGVDRYRPDRRRMYLRIPGSNRMSRRELGVLSELVAMRDRIARERDVPLKYILADDVVAGIATLRPRSVEELAQLRRLDGGARKSLGTTIVEAVRRGEAIPDGDLPAKPSRPLGMARETLVALMNVAVGEIARTNEMPPGLVVPRASLDRVAREVPATFAEFAAALDVSAWRTELIAEPLWRLLSGENALRVQGYSAGDPRITIQS